MPRPTPPIDHFEQAKRLARGNGADLHLLRKLAMLQAELTARGIAADDPRVPAYMAALFPPERAARGRLAGLPEEVLAGGSSQRDPATGTVVRQESWTDRIAREFRRLLGRVKKLARDWRSLLRRSLPYLALLGVLVAVLLWDRQGGKSAEDGTGQGAETPIQPEPSPPVDDTAPAPNQQTEFNPDFFIWLGAIWSSALIALLLLHLWRRQRLQKESDPDMDPVIRLALHLGRANLFAEPAAEQAWRQLRLRRRIASSRIDVRASVRATMAQAGYPTLRFDTRRIRPEYLIFSEREAPGDHLPEVGRALHAQMTRRQIDASHYEYQNAPHRLRLDKPSNPRGFEPLTSLLVRHEGARVLVSMESFDAAPARGDAPTWLERLGSQPFLLNPRAKPHWGREEAWLADHALPSIPANSAGLLSYARRVTSDPVGAAPPLPAKASETDLPAFFAAERDWLISDDALDDEQIAAIIDNLQRWAPREMPWLRALALFPVIHRAFTHFSAMALFGKTDLEGVSFLRVARLPWFRAGYMPDALREPLARGMTADELDDAKAVVQAFFASEAPTLTDAEDVFRLRLAQKTPKKRKQFRARLKVSNLPGLSDNLLRSAFETDDPTELSIKPIEVARRRWYRHPTFFAAMAALLATGALVWWLDSTRLVAVTDTTRERSDTGAVTPPVETEPTTATVATPTENSGKTTGGAATDDDPDIPSPPLTDLSVVVQVASEADRPTGEWLTRRLQEVGIAGARLNFDRVEVRGDSPRGTQIRCFEGLDCEKFASPLASRVSDLLGAEVSGQLFDDPSRGIEIWIADRDIPNVCNPGPYIVYFDWDSANLTPEAIALLDRAVFQYFTGCDGAYIYIAGHKDRAGSAAYNVGLSQRMANSVQSYLQGQGLPSGNMVTEAFGESRPAVVTADGVREPQNRRVEVTFGPGAGK